MSGHGTERPLLTLDFDGVICNPPFGRNVGIHRTYLDPTATPPAANVLPRSLSAVLDHLRFDLRRPVPEAYEALARLSSVRRLTILTGRRTSPEGWLRRYHLDRYVDDIVINRGPLKSPHFKLQQLNRMRPSAHVDDDPRTAQLLAEHGHRVYLRDWPRNRDLAFHAAVERIRHLGILADTLASSPEGTRT